MNIRNIIWWLIFTAAAVWAQSFLAGVDFLVVGLIISLQEENKSQTLWLSLFWLLIHEGTGSLAFGSGILWFAGIFIFYFFGRWLFEARNLVFILILGICFGAWHFALTHLMTALQDYTVSMQDLLWESVIQALIFPPAWMLTYRIRGKRSHDAYAL